MMNTLIILAVAIVAVLVLKRIMAGPTTGADEVLRKLRSGEAVLVDVREPSECASGVIDGALLMSLSDLQGGRNRWKNALEANKDKEFIVYCRSGARSGVAAGILRKEGFRVANAGGFGSLRSAGLPVKQP